MQSSLGSLAPQAALKWRLSQNGWWESVVRSIICWILVIRTTTNSSNSSNVAIFSLAVLGETEDDADEDEVELESDESAS